MNEQLGRRRWPLLVVSVLVFVGVSYVLLRTRTGNSTAPAGVDFEANPFEVVAVDRAAYDAVISRLRGRVVLVDFWATWCLPCMEQLPHTLGLGERYAQRGLEVVTVSCDEPKDVERVSEVLRSKHAAGATHLVSQYGGSPRTMAEFEIASGAVPFYKLYDRTGRLRFMYGVQPAAKKQFTLSDIDKAVGQLLAE